MRLRTKDGESRPLLLVNYKFIRMNIQQLC